MMFSNDDDKRDMNKIVLSLIIGSIGFKIDVESSKADHKYFEDYI